jgi:hypothetical protein
MPCLEFGAFLRGCPKAHSARVGLQSQPRGRTAAAWLLRCGSFDVLWVAGLRWILLQSAPIGAGAATEPPHKPRANASAAARTWRRRGRRRVLRLRPQAGRLCSAPQSHFFLFAPTIPSHSGHLRLLFGIACKRGKVWHVHTWCASYQQSRSLTRTCTLVGAAAVAAAVVGACQRAFNRWARSDAHQWPKADPDAACNVRSVEEGTDARQQGTGDSSGDSNRMVFHAARS